jgi:hypothetical protein
LTASRLSEGFVEQLRRIVGISDFEDRHFHRGYKSADRRTEQKGEGDRAGENLDTQPFMIVIEEPQEGYESGNH